MFEIKVRGRIGEDTEVKEMRILNRIVRVTPNGVRYEADPRHYELVARSLGLENSTSTVTPGIKPVNEETHTFKGEEGESNGYVQDVTGRMCKATTAKDGTTQIVECNGDSTARAMTLQQILGDYDNIGANWQAAATAAATKSLRVTFSDDATDVYNVTPYSEIYGVHPKSIVACSHGSFKAVSPISCPWTGKSSAVMVARMRADRRDLHKARARRRAILSRFLANVSLTPPGAVQHSWTTYAVDLHDGQATDGADNKYVYNYNNDYQLVSVDRSIVARGSSDLVVENLSVARTPSTKPKYGPARKGAKAVKKLERLEFGSHTLTPEEATMFRALSARANYLAQDRPDIAFSTKELCREFAVPTGDSYAKLKRVCRYLIGLPRLVYLYDWQDNPQTVDVYTDTDFAGCRTTRRSTSGGVIMLGTHCIRHWSTTQSTVSLSSGEAELHGISKGVQHGLGIKSLFKDLGMNMGITVHSDATAAIGIARRRGLGKLRHLDCEDLWLQQKIRNKDIALVKVLGAENPADALTKYVDTRALHMALGQMNMISESGRPESAPAAAS